MCGSVPVTVTRYEDDEECSNVSARKCAPATRQQCSDVEEQVPRQTLEQECNTELVEECSDARSSSDARAGGYN